MRQESVTLEDAGQPGTGDTVRLTATGGQQVTAVDAAALTPATHRSGSAGPLAEILVWEMHASVR